VRPRLPRRNTVRVVVGSDERTELADAIVDDLWDRGYEVLLVGPLRGDEMEWADVGRTVAETVATGGADTGVVCCWTGTGVSIAANKVPGIRAALCGDAGTAEGARKWNDANVLAMSLRSTSVPVAREMLDTWFSTSPEPDEAHNIAKVSGPG